MALPSVHGTEELQEIQASEIREKILAGEPAEFDNRIIVGYLDLSGLIIAVPVHFNHSIFQDPANFNYTTFNADAYFVKSNFCGDVHFLYSKFNRGANFLNSNFGSNANFWYSKFIADANFAQTQFRGIADFWDSEFDRNAYFWYSKFYSIAFFGKSTFNGTASFRYSEFNDDVGFGVSNFNGGADFWYSKFNGNAYFDYDKFSKDADFNEAIFNKFASFNNSQFIANAFFKNTTFQGDLALTETIYYKLFIRWYRIKHLIYDDTAYMSLMKNFNDLGYFEDYDSCYYQYRKEHRGQPWPGINPFEESVRKFFDMFLEIFYGYGKKPLLPLAWSFGTILVLGIFWGVIEQRRQEVNFNEYSCIQNINFKNKITSMIKPFLFSATVFLSGTKLFIDPPEVPNKNSSLIKVAFIFERVLGALFSILFFLAISGTVIR